MEFISIHAPRVGCDGSQSSNLVLSQISIHAPRVGCDIAVFPPCMGRNYFNPRTPCGVRLFGAEVNSQTFGFQSTHPVWGATGITRPAWGIIREFQSTHPVWGATYGVRYYFSETTNFNPRTPCGVRRSSPVPASSNLIISIHAPRVGCD